MFQPSEALASSLMADRLRCKFLTDFTDSNCWSTCRTERRTLCRARNHHASLSIRQATPHDAIAIRDVLKAAVGTLLGRPYTQAQIDAWIGDETSETPLCPSECGPTVFVAELNRCVIGYSRFTQSELEALYVHPAQKRRSVGETLLYTVEESISRQQPTNLSLDAALPAVPFYRSAGYRIVGPSAPLLDNGVTLPCLRMQKTLAARREQPSRIHDSHCQCQLALAVPASVSGGSLPPSVFSRRMLYRVARLIPSARAV